MNGTNLVALALVTLGIGCVLYAAVIGGLPLLAGPEATLEMLRWLDQATEAEPMPLIESLVADPLGLLLLTLSAMAIPMVIGMIFATVGFFIWRQKGRRALRLHVGNADRELEREEALQWLIRERLNCALAGELGNARGFESNLVPALADLDAFRRHRFDLFLHESRLDPLVADLPPAQSISAPSTAGSHRLLSRILMVLLAGMAGFAFLWGILSAFSVELMPNLLGFPEVSHLSLVALLGSWAGAFTLVTGAVGLHRLTRWNQRVEERWCAARTAAGERILVSYAECLTWLGGSQRQGDEGRGIALVRGLTVSAFQGLDKAGRSRLLAIGLERGIVPADSHLLTTK